MNEKEMLQYIMDNMATKDELTDIKNGMNAMESRVETIEGRLGAMEGRLTDRMDKGFSKLENLIDVAAKDAAQTEKKLREHMDTPHIA